MDIRNVQKTGNMFYLYLPTNWCRKNNIKPGSKISLFTNNDGSLAVLPHITEKKLKHLNIDLEEDDQSIINKLLVASYINPASSFKINLLKPVDIEKLLNQKKLISIEMVEFDRKHISCESTVSVEDPISLLKIMVKKVKNMLIVMRKSYNRQLLERYEDEIDRSKLLIEKSIISRLTFNDATNIRTIYLHYIALISKDLERAVDHLGMVEKNEASFFGSVGASMDFLSQILEHIVAQNNVEISYKEAINFTKKADRIETGKMSNMNSHNKLLVKQMLTNISEVIFDWSITYLVEEKNR